jgi:hypothetical protein
MKRKTILKSSHLKRKLPKILFWISAVVSACLLTLAATLSLNAQNQTASQEKQTTFETPEAAAAALIAAAEQYDQTALTQIFGSGSYDIFNTGEPVNDKEIAAEFAEVARKKMSITKTPRNRLLVYLTIGEENWQFPVPIVKKGKTWLFDTAAGRQEIMYRRIGRNELTAIEVCRGYVEAQHTYALTKHDGAIVNQYAQRIISTPGKHDGLAWQNADGTWGGTIGERAAHELEKTFTGKSAPFHGYYFKILRKQGPAAHLGTLDFVVKDAMIGGFALLAYPSMYRVTGVKSFIVSHDGVVYEKDLGSETATIAQGIDTFNPDKTWSPVFEDIQ